MTPTTTTAPEAPRYAPPAAAAAPAPRHGAGSAGSPVHDEHALVHPRLATAAIALLALLASFTSLRNGYAYDDVAIILQNPHVHTLDRWWMLFRQPYWPPPIVGGLYRPLVILLDAMLWRAGGGAPWPFHLASVLLYLATCLAVYRLTKLVLPARGAWVAAALYAVHPVHVECVANVVGQSELMTGLALTLATGSYLRARRASPEAFPARTAMAICGLFVFGALSKEHGVILPALLAAAELFLVADPRPWRARLRTVAPLVAALGVLGVAYVVARGTVPEVIEGQKFTAALGHFPWRVRLYTFFQIVPEWVRLLFWPARLSIDYSPQETLIPLVWTSGQYAGLAVLLFGLLAMYLGFRHSRPAGFAFAWLGITLALPSGLLVATGFLLAERTFFTPSVGAMILVGVVVEWALRRQWASERDARQVRVAVATCVAALLVAGTVRSALRQMVWKDNGTVFRQGLIDAPLSFRTHYAMGGWYFEHHQFAAGEREIRMSIRLFPIDPEPMELLAAQYVANQMWDPAIPLLRTATDLRIRANQGTLSMRRYPRNLLANVYMEKAMYDSAAAVAGRSVAIDPTDSVARKLLAAADSAIARRPAGAAAATAAVVPAGSKSKSTP